MIKSFTKKINIYINSFPRRDFNCTTELKNILKKTTLDKKLTATPEFVHTSAHAV